MPETGRPVPTEAVEAAEAAIVNEVEDKLSWNVRAYGKAWTGEGEDTEFIVGDSAELAIEAATPVLRAEWEREQRERLEVVRRWELYDPPPTGRLEWRREEDGGWMQADDVLACLTDTSEEKCENCGGRGSYVTGDAPHDESVTYREQCPTCNGTGTKQPAQGKEQSE